MEPLEARKIVDGVSGAESLAKLSETDYQLYRHAIDVVGRHWDTSRFPTLFPDQGPLRRELYAKHAEFMAAGAHATERCFFGGNRVAKTWTCAYELTCHVTGNYPDWWVGKRFHEPVQALAAGKTAETTLNVIQHNLFGLVRKSGQTRNYVSGDGMIPRASIIDDSILWRTVSIATLVQQCHIRYRDSVDERSVLTLGSYEQGRRVFEGFERHFIWLDEEVPNEIYSECLIRTATVDGRVVLSFTPLDGVTDIVLSFVPHGPRASQASGRQHPWQPEEDPQMGAYA